MLDKFLTALKSIQEITREKEKKEETSFIKMEEKNKMKLHWQKVLRNEKYFIG